MRFPLPLLSVVFALFAVCLAAPLHAEDLLATLEPLVRVVDLNLGESAEVTLCDGSKATVKLLDLHETRDGVCFAVRRAEATVEVNGKQAALVSATYNLPQTVGDVQIDCSITKGYNENGTPSFWGLDKDARLRLWPAGSPLVRPGTFVYPVKQKWFATDTQMANDPVYVDGGDQPGKRNIYYHSGLDIGGSEGLVEVVAATDAQVVSVGETVLPGHEKDTPVSPRYDVVYLRDARGWYYRYSHLKEIDKQIVPGRVISKGDRIGLLGKEGGSGGWSHLHFEIKSRQPSGKWGTQEGYAFLWEAYQRQYKPAVTAVARPHQAIWAGESVTLDGSKSRSAAGRITKYVWSFDDGATAEGARVERTYKSPGRYSEVLQATDEAGNVGYDFAVVTVADRRRPERKTPSIHPNYYPTMGIKPGDEITFKVRTFNTTHGKETWNFGDGSPEVQVQSDGNAVKLSPDGYAVTKHAYKQPGDYIVHVSRTNEHGVEAKGHLHVHVAAQGRQLHRSGTRQSSDDFGSLATSATGGQAKATAWVTIAPYFSPPEEFAGEYGDYRSPLKFNDGSPVRTKDDWKQRRAEIHQQWTKLLGEWPPLITEPQVENLESQRRDNFTQHRVRFKWTPNETTTGYLLIPDGEGKRPAVLTVYYEPETAVGLQGEQRDFAYQLARRGFVTLSIGTTEESKANIYALYYPEIDKAEVQPLSMLGCAAANAWYVLASRPEVDSKRIGVVGHSFGGKWSMFAGCLFDRFAAVAVSDPGIMFDTHPSVNYWEPWYLGWHPRPWRKRGVITDENPGRGLYPKLLEEGRDLHELHALLAPRPFLVSGGAVDPPERWRALNHLVKINKLLGYENRVGMTNRPDHSPNPESNAVIYAFFEHFLGSSEAAQ
ncbi:MAG: PKD domain-containing protein [Pirellulaceae bacterium]